MSRGEFWSRVNRLADEVDPMTSEAYRFCEILEAQEKERGDAHKDPWHISFHGSQFPGDDTVACGRKSLYRMLDLPRGPFDRLGRQFMDQGKDFENQIVRRWWRAGYLLSNPPLPGISQTQFEDPPHLLTSTVDAITLPLRSQRSIVVEVKHIYANHVDEMVRLIRQAHSQYVRQLKCQIGMAHEAGPQKRLRCFNTGRLAIWDPTPSIESGVHHKRPFCPQHGHEECLEEVEVLPPNYGYLYYSSRDKPTDTWEFYYEYDPDFMEAGRNKLASWRDNFINDELPATNFEDKRFSHPFGWFWSKEEFPCKWCDYGDICRDDHKAAVANGGPIKLSESVGVAEAKELDPEYSYEEARDAVLKRWGINQKAA